MASITASMVKDLRESTGAGMMDCKAALTETNGDMQAAQDWLRAQGYEPTVFEGSPLLFWLSHFVPWVHRDGHPDEDLQAGRYRVSMPASLEAFVLRREPGTRRLEICHDERRVVVRRGGAPFGEVCVAGEGDLEIGLD